MILRNLLPPFVCSRSQQSLNLICSVGLLHDKRNYTEYNLPRRIHNEYCIHCSCYASLMFYICEELKHRYLSWPKLCNVAMLIILTYKQRVVLSLEACLTLIFIKKKLHVPNSNCLLVIATKTKGKEPRKHQYWIFYYPRCYFKNICIFS
jgi:hypothetical protein